MPPLLRRLHIDFAALPVLLGLYTGALLGLLLTAWVLATRHGHALDRALDDYGGALVRRAAAEAQAFAGGRERLALQALLQGYVRERRVQGASAVDSSGQLLAEAGRRSLNGKLYVAPIGRAEDQLGEIRLYVEPNLGGERPLQYAFSALVLLLLGLIALSLYDCYGSAWRIVPRPAPTPPPADTPPAPASAPPEPLDASLSYCDLVVLRTNYRLLKARLSGDLLAAADKRFNKQLGRVLALYGGVRIPSPEGAADVHCARFMSGDSVSDAAFRAACSAHVLQQLLRRSGPEQRVRFDLLGQVCGSETDLELPRDLKGLFLSPELQDAELSGKLELRLAGSRCQITGFKPPYAESVARQADDMTAA